jgi:addiction module RelB/DinJ family antitoxin
VIVLQFQITVAFLHSNKYNINIFKYNRMATTLVQARVDTAVKEKVEQYFHSFGMDTATAIRIFFAKVATTGTIPFTIGVDAEDVYDAMIGEQAYAEYVAGGKKSRPIEELLKELEL